MLILISLGLYEMHDMSYKAIRLARKCDVLYMENYTHLYSTPIDHLEKFLARKIVPLERKDVENESDKLIKEAKEKIVGLLVGGDCLSATTHISLLLDAKKEGVETKVVHGSSIFTAIAETGLSLYNFGKTVSVPFNFKDVNSFMKLFEENHKLGMHTLFLFDLDPKNNKFLDSRDFVRYLVDLNYGDLDCVICGALGSEKAKIKYSKVKDLVDYQLNVYPQCLIIPGKMHFVEEEALKRF